MLTICIVKYIHNWKIYLQWMKTMTNNNTIIKMFVSKIVKGWGKNKIKIAELNIVCKKLIAKEQR